jgi:hypothetical protein
MVVEPCPEACAEEASGALVALFSVSPAAKVEGTAVFVVAGFVMVLSSIIWLRTRRLRARHT